MVGSPIRFRDMGIINLSLGKELYWDAIISAPSMCVSTADYHFPHTSFVDESTDSWNDVKDYRFFAAN
jgi:hypothetical protein